MHLRSKILFVALSFIMTSTVLGQTPFNVDVTVTGLSNDTVYLANYYGAKLYYSDTTVADAQGHFSFKGKAYNECGKYAVVLPGPVFFDIMLVNEPMEFRTTKSNPQGNMVVLKSDENIVFYDYLSYLNTKREERSPHDAILNDSTSSPLQDEIAKNAMVLMNSEVVEYQDALIDDPETIFSGNTSGCLGTLKSPTHPTTLRTHDFGITCGTAVIIGTE